MMSEVSNMKNITDGQAVIIQDVKKDYQVKGRTVPVKALRGVTLTIKEGSMVAIKGESGSGKTTLLQMIGALDVPTSGTVVVAGKDLSHMSETELTEYRGNSIGIVFQSFYLIPNLTALENVELPMEALNVSKEERRTRAAELLKSVGMNERMDYKPLKLSGGEQQRVAIARSLANNPAIILADEPTGNLDSKTGREIIRLLNKLRKEKGTTVIVVTHSDGAAKACDYTFTIHDGKIASKKDLASEEELRVRKKSIRSTLAVSGKVMSKLFRADFDTLEKIASATIQELLEITGDQRIAKKIGTNSKEAYEKELAKKTEVMKMLSSGLNVSEDIIKRLFDADIDSLEAIDDTEYDDILSIVGDEAISEKIMEKAEAMLNEM